MTGGLKAAGLFLRRSSANIDLLPAPPIAGVNVLQLVAVATVRIAVGVIVIVVVVIVGRAVSREERAEMPEVAVIVAITSAPEAAALHPGKSGAAGRHRTGPHGEAPGAETTGPETAHAGKPASVKSTAAKATVAPTAKAAAVASPTAARKRERGRKCANCRNGGQRDHKFFEHRSTPQTTASIGDITPGVDFSSAACLHILGMRF